MAMEALVNGHSSPNRDGNPKSERLQIVNDEKRFTPELSAQIERWGLRDVGFDYNVVAVFGSQSTGKSTLLNRLFGTTFDVMNESNRQQTTKGIWMCRGQGMNVMVMDVEGTDGRERGEDQDFERKSALFSLASSEVLIINLWEHQVGLYQGANMGLLKTVFEVNLGLFGKRTLDVTTGRTLLLFVIRDHLGVTPLSNLSRTLQADVTKIWDSISKPEDLQDRKLEDYFDLAFTTLPHKILTADKFEEGVADLRKRFTDKENPDFVFKPIYHKRIPADGVAHYMEGIWEQVQSNKDLDLPTQQELLAQFRCDEIANVALEQFSIQARSQKRPIEIGNVVDGLGAMMRSWKDQALTQFDREASRYHKGVYHKKRNDLTGQLNSILSPLFLGQLKNIHKSVLIKFKEELRDGVRGDNYNYGEVVSQARERLEKRFQEAVLEVRKVREDSDSEEQWSWREEEELLRAEVEAVATQMRSDETKKMLNQSERNIRKGISDPVELYLTEAKPDMWDKVLTLFQGTLEKAESTYISKAKSFDCTDAENTLALAVLRRRAWLALRSKIDEQIADTALIGKLRARFEDKFRYDENGVPRVWKPGDDIDSAFRQARDDTLELISLYASITPKDPSISFTLPSEPVSSSSDEDEFDFSSTLHVLSPTKAADITTRFRRDADAFFVEAKRSTVSSVAQIPVWMYAVLVVLGWNEAMAILFNPLYFVLVIGALSVMYIIFQLNLSGPLYQVTITVTDEIRRQITKRLREHFSEPALAAPNSNSRDKDIKEEDFVQ
ncbi:Dynamin-like GTPase that mediates homotypic ERfusion [Clathrus columnatus]|uniref:Dynamin-like GTPase that mediates homotypic ERfusion n=1 Tax=Clathrus columnatus TaxID=1419009 RepID=A0AAV4ZYT1_9AGAM|nr:Dynamin-like GTPase that mediates homotypic ERfusion [Clathrus columnatus]